MNKPHSEILRELEKDLPEAVEKLWQAVQDNIEKESGEND